MEGVYRFEFVISGDYDAAYTLFQDTLRAALVIDPRSAMRWGKLEDGKPVYVPSDDDDG